MDQHQWDEAYASTELVWTAEANRFVVEELAGLPAGHALDLAEKRGVTGVQWLEADLRVYRPGPAAYDLVLIAYIHLLPDEFGALLRTAASALVPGGTLLVVGHDVDNIAHGHGGPQDPRILHRAQDVVAGLPGLTIHRAEQALRQVPTSEGERVAIDTVVRAQRP